MDLITNIILASGNFLPVVVEHIFDFHRGRRNAQNLVTPVHDFSLRRNEDVLTLRQENFLGSPGWLAKPKNFSSIGGGGGG